MLPHPFIGGYQYVEAPVDGCFDQFSVLDPVQTLVFGRSYFMLRQVIFQPVWRAVIGKNLHRLLVASSRSAWKSSTALMWSALAFGNCSMNSGMLNPAARLVNSVETGSLVPSKHHAHAHDLGVAFYVWALPPVDLSQIVVFGLLLVACHRVLSRVSAYPDRVGVDASCASLLRCRV